MIHFAFLAQGEAATSDRCRFIDFCLERNLPPPEQSAKLHQIVIGPATLRWEQHSEFTTFTWIWTNVNCSAADQFDKVEGTVRSLIRALRQTGQLLVAIRLEVEQDTSPIKRAEQIFDKNSLAMVATKSGLGVAASDFRVDEKGFTKILVSDLGLTSHDLGALVQRLLEIETYRPLALLGLSAALELAPSVDRIDRRLVEALEKMQSGEGLQFNNHLLAELTALAASFERGATGSLFRFGASRAYNELVQSRLSIIEGNDVSGYPTWSSFLARRMAPAMRTCATVEDRQATLSVKLARAADLLRTRVDVEIERQNRDLLQAINERARQQLRLQCTVEGLSVGAIGYYVVSLFSYLAKGAHDVGLRVEPSFLTAAFVPIAVGVIWLVSYNVRKRHLKHDDAPSVTCD
ncbi:putative membrane-anchored protein [Bradyrhizobium sp. USDA 4454]